MSDFIYGIFKVGDKGGKSTLQDGAMVAYTENPIFSDHMKRVYSIIKLNKSTWLEKCKIASNPIYESDNITIIKERAGLIDFNEIETALEIKGYVNDIRSKSSIGIIDGTLLGLEFLKDSNNYKKLGLEDINSVSSGTYSVGTAKTYSDYVTAAADIAATITGNLTFELQTNVTQTSSVVITENLSSYILKLSTDTPHIGDPTAGHIVTVNGFIHGFLLEEEGALGTMHVDGLQIKSIATASFHALIATNAMAAASLKVRLNDLILDGAGFHKHGFWWATGKTPTEIHNCYFSDAVASNFLMNLSGNVSSIVLENVTSKGSVAGFDLTGRFATLNSCVAYGSSGLDFTDIGGSTGNNNASEDTSVDNANWSTGANNVKSIVPANEFGSIVKTASTFNKVQQGGSLDTAGIATTISSNTIGIRGNDRPGSDASISIGADELEITGTDFTLTSVTPAAATFKGGTALVIIGTGFDDLAYTIDIGGVSCTNVVRVSSTKLTCTTASTTAANVTNLTVDGGGDNETIAFSYLKAKRITILEEMRTALQDIKSVNGFNFTVTADKIVREPVEDDRWTVFSFPILYISSGEEEEITPVSNCGDRNVFRIAVHGLVSSDTDFARAGKASDEYEKLIKDIKESVMSYFANGNFSDFIIEVSNEQAEQSEFFDEGQKVVFNFIFDNTLTEI